MAWTAPVTWVDSTAYDAADFDQQLKGNLEFLYDPPSCLTHNTSNQSISSSTSNTNVSMQTEVWDTDGMHSGSSHQHDINTAGRFLSFGMWVMDSNATGRRVLTLDPSAGQNIESRIPAPGGGVAHSAQASGTFELGTSDTVALLAQQNSGGALNVLANTAWMLNHWAGNP